jgi:transposase
MRSIGLDVGRTKAAVAIHEQGGPTRSAGTISLAPADLAAFAASLGPDDQVALEATSNTWPIAGLLAQHAGRVVVSNPIRTRAIAEAKIKTDTIDAATLADLLAADYLPEVWQPDATIQLLRRLVAARTALVRQQTGLRNRVSGILARNLVACPWSDPFGRGGRAWLAQVELPADERQTLDANLRLLDVLAAEVAAADVAIARAVADDPAVRRLLTVPGLGLVSCVSLYAAIGDVHRFARPAKLVSYLGLDPRVRQSGNRPAVIGHISHAGPARARSVLVEAAHAAVRTPGPLHAFYARVAARRGHGIALVAVARKLAVLAWHLLHDEADYRWSRPSLVAKKVRAVELTAGAPRRGSTAGRASAADDLAAQRALEQAVLERAEAAYVALVRARAADAPAATRGATGQAKADARQAARRR